MSAIILFDGVCNFCNGSVQFIIKRDPTGYYTFASLQGEVGKKLLEEHQLGEYFDSFVLVENNKCFFGSEAAFRICRHLKGAWKFISVFTIVPKPIRDFFYHMISKNRYKWFGKRESCMIPTKEIRKRFLE
jgi:predicted DCC family thiol-disulfide oxidoreductase YuxK